LPYCFNCFLLHKLCIFVWFWKQ